jgi:hypothetical protein
VDPFDETVRVDTRTAAGDASRIVQTGRIESTVVAGFWIDAAWLWQSRRPPTLACLREILGPGEDRRSEP